MLNQDNNYKYSLTINNTLKHEKRMQFFKETAFIQHRLLGRSKGAVVLRTINSPRCKRGRRTTAVNVMSSVLSAIHASTMHSIVRRQSFLECKRPLTFDLRSHPATREGPDTEHSSCRRRRVTDRSDTRIT